MFPRDPFRNQLGCGCWLFVFADGLFFFLSDDEAGQGGGERHIDHMRERTPRYACQNLVSGLQRCFGLILNTCNAASVPTLIVLALLLPRCAAWAPAVRTGCRGGTLAAASLSRRPVGA